MNKEMVLWNMFRFPQYSTWNVQILLDVCLWQSSLKINVNIQVYSSSRPQIMCIRALCGNRRGFDR